MSSPEKQKRGVKAEPRVIRVGAQRATELKTPLLPGRAPSHHLVPVSCHKGRDVGGGGPQVTDNALQRLRWPSVGTAAFVHRVLLELLF